MSTEKRILVRFDEDTLKRISEQAKKEGLTDAVFIRHITMCYLNRVNEMTFTSTYTTIQDDTNKVVENTDISGKTKVKKNNFLKKKEEK